MIFSRYNYRLIDIDLNVTRHEYSQSFTVDILGMKHKKNFCGFVPLILVRALQWPCWGNAIAKYVFSSHNLDANRVRQTSQHPHKVLAFSLYYCQRGSSLECLSALIIDRESARKLSHLWDSDFLDFRSKTTVIQSQSTISCKFAKLPRSFDLMSNSLFFHNTCFACCGYYGIILRVR